MKLRNLILAVAALAAGASSMVTTSAFAQDRNASGLMDDYRHGDASVHPSTRITAAQRRAGIGPLRQRQHAGGFKRMRL